MFNMETLEKRDYIHSHLHLIDEKVIKQLYQNMYSEFEENDTIVGFNPYGKPIEKQQVLADLIEAEKQIESGEYITLKELEEDSKTW